MQKVIKAGTGTMDNTDSTDSANRKIKACNEGSFSISFSDEDRELYDFLKSQADLQNVGIRKFIKQILFTYAKTH